MRAAPHKEGPTGLTIIRFMLGAAVVSDSCGGAPATVNTHALRLGYDGPRIDAIVFSGGAVYGEEAVTAVMTGLKDEGVRSGARDDRARATGAVINDLDGRRLNEIYPDKRLAQATLGAQGVGRMAMQGSFFGCQAHSGQGAAFREINGVKIAALSSSTPSVRLSTGNATSFPTTQRRAGAGRPRSPISCSEPVREVNESLESLMI